MSVLWQLSGDLLHSVYGEWLGWKDLSRLDIACVGKKSDREIWLTSLTDLRMTKEFHSSSLSDEKMKSFYKWLKSRKVLCMKVLPVRVSILDELVVGGLDMESYCLALRSIEIETWYDDSMTLDRFQLENNLSVFLSYCHNLQAVTVTKKNNIGNVSDIVLPVLVEKLRENSLVKFSLRCTCTSSICTCMHYESHTMMIARLITKHASSLRDLSLPMTEGMDLITSTLIENRIRLRVLTTSLNSSLMLDCLISYFSSAGDFLEILELKLGPSSNIDDLMVTMARSCPKLTCFIISNGTTTCSIGNLRHLYEQCPHLQDVSIVGTIEAYDRMKPVTIVMRGSNEDWAICLSHALRRRQCKQVILKSSGEEDFYHPVGNLKSMLEPYQIELQVCTFNHSLISLLQDLPHLNSFHLKQVINNQYTDAVLVAIKEHANSLTDLDVTYKSATTIEVRRLDQLLSELIKTCQLLTKLRIYRCGMESLVAVSEHSSLRVVHLSMCEITYRGIWVGLLLDEKVQWPSTLEVGTLAAFGYKTYKFNKKSPHWTKC